MAIRYKVTERRESYPGRIGIKTYLKGDVVEGGAYGIFLFKRKKDAENYAKHSRRNRLPEILNLEILKVRTIGKGRKMTLCPTFIQLREGIDRRKVLRMSKKYMYKRIEFSGDLIFKETEELWACAPGTMTYPAVEVLT